MGAMQKSIYTPEYAALRAELRKLREKAGLSQRELALRLRVPHSWVAKVETGERRIDLVEFGWFASACGIAPFAVLERLLPRLTWKARPPMKGGRAK
jgi:transcriptional regulator with XRE-family HTH domain